jgi:PadR family transcriptional regulator PadR
VAKPFLTFSSTLILQAVANGYRYGFDIIAVTGLPSGTVYPALRRLEDVGFLTSNWEKESDAASEARPARRYYDITRAGREGLADAALRFHMRERGPFIKPRTVKPSRA